MSQVAVTEKIWIADHSVTEVAGSSGFESVSGHGEGTNGISREPRL
jgi:hypothetical protein